MKGSTKLSAALTISLLSAAASAQSSFEFHDEDNNGQISKDEFYGAVSDKGVFPDWDTDSDGFITIVEFETAGVDGDFDMWDTDSDSNLDTNELYDGAYNFYDKDESGHWDGDEWDDAGDAGWVDV